MHARDLHRPAEGQTIDSFLGSFAVEPSALIIEGEAGIGKTTLWQAALDEARRRGYEVLAARPSAAEVTLAHASVADLLRAARADALRELPPPQRVAASRVLQLSDVEGATDQQAIGAALLSVVEGLAAEGPVLLAVDDAQWLDASSAAVLGFVVRRLSGSVGVLVTVRTGTEGSQLPWLHLSRPESVTRTTLRPLPPETVRAVLTERLGRPFSRSVMQRIQQTSGGNPFYALELGRAVRGSSEEMPLSATLGDLVRGRFDDAGTELRDLLLAVASVQDATVELLQTVCRLPDDRLVALLEEGEERGLLVVEGHHVRFAHPLLAAAVHGDAGPAGRRRMHGRLAAVVEEPEQRARHLALAAVRRDPDTLAALDEAAVLARARGAPAAAAELLELALGLGGATPERTLQAALHHFEAGDTDRARRDLEKLVQALPAGNLRARTKSVLGLVRLHDDSFVDAATMLEEALVEVAGDLRQRVQILVWLSYAETNAGRLEAAYDHVTDAVREGERLGDHSLLAQAVVLRATLSFMRGHGLDEPELERALRLDGDSSSIPVAFRPGTQAVLLRAWTGRLDEAAPQLDAIRRAAAEQGQENDLVFPDFHSTLVEVWRGDFAEAEATAAAAMERALQLDGDVPLAVARGLRGLTATYLGDVDTAREEAEASLTIYRRCGWSTLVQWPIATLGLLHVSTGDHRAALNALEPLLRGAPDRHMTAEIISSSYVPDAVEALVHLGRLDEAEELLEPFVRAGRRLDRAWTLATAGRCAAMLLAARGDIEAASAAAEEAMAEHDRLPMPFERARTQLLLGQLQRRRRKKEAAASLSEAARVFEQLGAALWVERAQAELARISAGNSPGDDLTPTERRVAELAASGLTNREVAGELFISPKTVEANLARAYRKLDIRSRAELGQLMGPGGS